MGFNERELEEMESVGHYMRSILSDSQVEDWRIFDCLKKLEKIGLILQRSKIENIDLVGIDINELKEVVHLFLDRVEMHLLEDETK